MDEGAPGWGDAAERLWRIVFPTVRVTAPARQIQCDWDVPIVLQDGTTLRANVFRPEGSGRYPVMLSAHPYGKDDLPRKSPLGGYLPLTRYRFLRQGGTVRF